MLGAAGEGNSVGQWGEEVGCDHPPSSVARPQESPKTPTAPREPPDPSPKPALPAANNPITTPGDPLTPHTRHTHAPGRPSNPTHAPGGLPEAPPPLPLPGAAPLPPRTHSA